MSELVERIARHVLTTRFEDLSAAAVVATQTFALDTLGVTLAGSRAPFAANVRGAAQRWGAGEEASVLGGALRLPAPAAAFVNGYQAHCQEYDCIHEPAVVHPLASIQSAAFATAERRGGVSGQQFVAALAVGVDVAASIGMAAKAKLAFFRPATAGVFGATAAVAKLENLDHARFLDALGVAYSQAAGNMQSHVEGKPTLALQIACAARAAVNAVDLAQAGVPGPHDVLEGPFGYFPLMEREWDPAKGFADFASTWRITQVSHKPFPSGRATHGGIDGILALRARHGVHADDVRQLTLRAPPLIHQLVGRPLLSDMSVSYAQLCFQFVGALALQQGTVDIPDFSPERLGDPGLLRRAERIRVVIDDNPDPNAMAPQEVIATLISGAELRVAVPHAIGSPANPLTREQHLNKFRRNCGYAAPPLAAGAAERLIETFDRLHEVGDMRSLRALVTSS